MACAESRLPGIAFATAAALALAACATLPVALPELRAFPGVPPERDLRAEYRAAVCVRLKPGPHGCEEMLLREEREAPPPAGRSAPRDLARRYRIGLVPGLFAECLAPVAKALGDVEPGLRAHGYDVTYLNVAGRGTAASNARYLAERLRPAEGDSRPIILVTYSKGLLDALEFLVTYPIAARQVAAVVSIAGAANGSPLAEAYQDTYRKWLARLPMTACARSDGSEILDLNPEVRREWWRVHGAQVRVPVFSLVTTPRADRLSAGLGIAHASLSEIDPRNDGKILWYDQLVPGNYLLGFLNADHWAVGTPLDASLPWLAFLFEDNIPRLALVEGAIEVAAAILDDEARRRAPGGQ